MRGRFAAPVEGNRNIPFIPAAHLVSELRADVLKKEKAIRNISFRIQLDNTFRQGQIFDVYNTETITPGYALLNMGFSTDIYEKKKNIAKFQSQRVSISVGKK